MIFERKNRPGNTLEMKVAFQEKGIKANRTTEPVLVVVIITLETYARQKQSNAITARELDSSRNNAGRR